MGKIFFDNIKWGIGLALTVLGLSFTGVSYISTNYVTKDSFALVCDQLATINSKIDRIIERQMDK